MKAPDDAKKPVKFYYVLFKCVPALPLNPQTPVTVKAQLIQNLKCLFGVSASSVGFDLLIYDDETRFGVIRVALSLVVKLRCAMTVCRDSGLRFDVIKSTPCLSSLVSNSRTFKHEKRKPKEDFIV